MKRFQLVMTLLIGFLSCQGQGDLLSLNDAFYLDSFQDQPFDCDSLPHDGITSYQDRICANLKLQAQDQLLKIYYDSVRVELLQTKSDTLLMEFESLQASWRTFRDQWCETLHGGYATSTGAVIYMDAMRRLTEIRIEEMKALLKEFRIH